jgi:hypothetical protein
MQFTDLKHPPGQPIIEEKIGSYATEQAAVDVARGTMEGYIASQGDDYVWWIVRSEGSTLARWIADSRDQQEFVLDLRSGQLVPLE